MSAYENLCKAVINAESEVRFNISMLDDVLQLFYTSFPLSALVDKVEKNEDNSGVTLTYKYSFDEHNKRVEAFEAKVKEIEEYCYNGTLNKNIYAIRLYNYITSSIAESSDATIGAYDTIINGEGTMNSYANMFEYLLLQADIPAYHILAEDAAGSAWSLSGAELDGEIYYFDMMTEFYTTEGKQLRYFGMTSEDVKNEGLTNLNYTDMNPAAEASSLYFDTCRSCVSWEIEGSNLLVTTSKGIVVEVAL